MPEVELRPNTWFSEDSVKTLHTAWKNADNNTEKYVRNVFENMSGRDGKKVLNGLMKILGNT